MLDSMREILAEAEEKGVSFGEIVLQADMEERQVTREASMDKMRLTWRAMLEADNTYQAELRSVSGLVGGDGGRMRAYAAKKESICGGFISEVISAALHFS